MHHCFEDISRKRKSYVNTKVKVKLSWELAFQNSVEKPTGCNPNHLNPEVKIWKVF